MAVKHTLGSALETLGLNEATILVNAIQRVCDRIRAVSPELAQDGKLIRQIAALMLNDLDFETDLVQAYAQLLRSSAPEP